MSIPLQEHIVYGPLESRRFGRSLGINLLPPDQKICQMNCIYCQYGKTTEPHKPIKFPTLENVEAELRSKLEKLNLDKEAVSWITVAGNGEPTLYPDFKDAMQLIRSLKDEYCPKASLGILSNSLVCQRPGVQEGLKLADLCFMKLDAGSPKFFCEINGADSKSWEDVIRNLKQISNLVIQSMFIQGRINNCGARQLKKWIDCIQEIEPIYVQIYSLDREPWDSKIEKVPKPKMDWIARLLFDRTRIPSIVYG